MNTIGERSRQGQNLSTGEKTEFSIRRRGRTWRGGKKKGIGPVHAREGKRA